MSYSFISSKRIEVEYTECTKEWFRVWTSFKNSKLLAEQYEEFLAHMYGRDLSERMFEIYHSGHMVTVRWMNVPEELDVLNSVLYTEITTKEAVFTTTTGDEAFYLTNHFRRILPPALFEVRHFGHSVTVRGVPYTMQLPHDVIDWACGGEIIIEADKEFELSFDLIRRIEHILLGGFMCGPEYPSLHIMRAITKATHAVLYAKAQKLVGEFSPWFDTLPLSAAGKRAKAAYKEYLENPELARPFAEVRAELGLEDKDNDD